MSLSSFLLAAGTKAKDKGKAIDGGLDDFFRSKTVVDPSASVVPASEPKTIAEGKENHAKEKKRKQPADEALSSPKSKKHKAASVKESVNAGPEKKYKERKSSEDTESSVRTANAKHKKKHAKSEDSSEEDEEGHASSSTPAALAEETVQTGEPEPASDSDDEGDPSTLVHESIADGNKSKHGSRKTKYVPPEETAEKRNERTVFVGNVAVDVVKDRPLQKQFKRHILSFVPAAKIESVRFRSVAFNKPTASLPNDEASSNRKDSRQHDRDRAASWRKSKGDDEEHPDAGKTFLTPAEKKRVAFIKHEFHESVDAVNAYVVFAHPPPTADAEKSKHVPPSSPVMDPYEAARAVVKNADASAFLGRTLRVDVVGRNKTDVHGEMKGDPKATVFVGNLDFASKEEDLRAFFEALMIAEKGKPGKPVAESEGDDEFDDEDENEDEDEEQDAESTIGKGAETKSTTWVKRVRIIRDKDTLLGKGFAYVQFTVRLSVPFSPPPPRLRY
ncbi:hypothetical protein NM688_g5617 [Phlebia brevispora]|uniref:Uncharacterized protein n=1 Tax=Phlebia brevispora TaxID=194682 RepID=A0ACC1SSG4_9APHY|nr:hypothetical protein NM688_g5617 [Phlebia brevispora]